jgi:IS5 family transposase
VSCCFIRTALRRDTSYNGLFDKEKVSKKLSCLRNATKKSISIGMYSKKTFARKERPFGKSSAKTVTLWLQRILPVSTWILYVVIAIFALVGKLE